MDNNYKIYGLKEKGTDNIKYIGVTKLSLERRLYYHLRDTKNKKSCWLKSINNNVEIVLIEDNLDQASAFKKEIIYIKIFKSFGAKLKNMTSGGENPPNNLGKICSSKTRENIRKATLGKSKDSKGLKNHKSRQIAQIDKINGEILYVYNSITEAIKLTGIAKRQLQKILKFGIANYHGGGFNWKYITKKEYLEFDLLNKVPLKCEEFIQKIPIICIKGEEILEFESISEAARELNLHDTNITKCLKKERLHTGGIKFMYKNG